MTLPTDEEIEAAARWMCERQRKDPDEILEGDYPPRRRWGYAADDLNRHALMNEALALNTPKPIGPSAAHGKTRKVVALTKEEAENLFVGCEPYPEALGPWRPIGEAKRWDDYELGDDIEICFPRERVRMFGLVGLSLSNGQYVIMTNHPDFNDTDLDYAVEQGWRWKEPTPLPEVGE